MFNFKRPDWFKRGRKIEKTVEPIFPGFESEMKYMIVPKSPIRWEIRQILRNAEKSFIKRTGREPLPEEWSYLTYSTSEIAAKARIEEILRLEFLEFQEKNRDLIFQREHLPYTHPPE